MAAVHQIVIIGASFSGIPVAHGLLKDVLPKVGGEKAYKVTAVAPSDHFFFKIGAPRTIVNPEKLPVEKVLVPIADGFKAYPVEKYEFVKAYVTSIDPSSKTVHTSTSASLRYDTLVIASGTSYSSDLWSIAHGVEPLSAALNDIHKRLPEAKSVLVVGGGPAGVETAGELGERYGGQKEITLLSGAGHLLPRLKNANIGKDAEGRLAKMKVKVIHNVKVSSTSSVGSQTTVQLSNGTSMTVDAYIEATGDRPNNKFIPPEWLDARGFVKTNPRTLRLDAPNGAGVYSIGSIASHSDGTAIDVKFSTKPLLESIKVDLMGQDITKQKLVYKKMTSDMQIVPLGSSGGVGVIMGWKAPSFMVRFIKAKDFMVGEVPKLINGTG